MKASIRTKEPEFQPFQLVLDVETTEDLEVLYTLFAKIPFSYAAQYSKKTADGKRSLDAATVEKSMKPVFDTLGEKIQ